MSQKINAELLPEEMGKKYKEEMDKKSDFTHFFTVTKPMTGKVDFRYNKRHNMKKEKRYGSSKGTFSSLGHRYHQCKDNPIHPTQTGLVIGYYWGPKHHSKENIAPVKIFTKTCPIGKNIRKSKIKHKMRKHRNFSNRHYSFTYRFTSKFKKLIKKLDTRPGLKLNLSHGSSWIKELGKKYPLIGG